MKSKGSIVTAAVAVVVVGMFAMASLSGCIGKNIENDAGVAERYVMQSVSQRGESPGAIVVPDTSPFYALLATPVAVYYGDGATRNAISGLKAQVSSVNGVSRSTMPLLVVDPTHPASHVDNTSIAVMRFLSYYGANVLSIGDVGNLPLNTNNAINMGASSFTDLANTLSGGRSEIAYSILPKSIGESYEISGDTVKEISLSTASAIWNSSKYAMIVSENSYSLGIAAAPIASYLNMPIIVAEEIDNAVIGTLNLLGVESVFIVGTLDAKGLVVEKKFSTQNEIRSYTLDIIQETFGGTNYITMTNPTDVTGWEIIEECEPQKFSGTVTDTAPATIKYKVPEGNVMAVAYFTSDMDPARVDITGQRMYMFFNDPEGVQYAFDGDPSFLVGKGYSESMIINKPGEYSIQMAIKGISVGVPLVGDLVPLPVSTSAGVPETANYDLTVQCFKLKDPAYAHVMLSPMSAYLTAYRQGVIVADDKFAPWSTGVPSEFSGVGEAAKNVDAFDEFNGKAEYAIGVRNGVLNMMKEKGMYEYYIKQPFLAIMADTNMIPWYYYPGGDGAGYEGEPGDTPYMDIEALEESGGAIYDEFNAMLELAVARPIGATIQDASALISRTFFYNEILDVFVDRESGHKQGFVGGAWKENAWVAIGSEAAPTVAVTMAEPGFYEVQQMFSNAGFNVYANFNIPGVAYGDFLDRARQATETVGILGGSVEPTAMLPHNLYSSSNIWWVMGHGNFYVYDLTAGNPVNAWSEAYDNRHLRDYEFGPSAATLVSCITGMTDGHSANTTISQIYIHDGVNAYHGAARSAISGINVDESGSTLESANLINKLWAEEIIVNGKTVGEASRDSKNTYRTTAGQLPDILGLIGSREPIEWEHYVQYGDPAFNPYDVLHEGASS